QARILQAAYPLDPARRGELLREALDFNHRAEDCYADGERPRGLWSQRAEVAGLLGQQDEADRLREKAAATPLRTARDYYLSAVELATRQRYADALPLLREANRLDRKHFWAWMLLGRC